MTVLDRDGATLRLYAAAAGFADMQILPIQDAASGGSSALLSDRMSWAR